MSYCMNCGQQMPDGARFCQHCGAAMGVPKQESSQRTTTYDGEIHKCPNCGETLKSFMTTCPTCGYEIRSLKTKSPVEELANKIENAASVEEENDLIANFYVPNTKEDIFDFFIMAVSHLENSSHETDDAWRSKLEQTYHKAKMSFGDTPDFEYLNKTYKQTLSHISKHGFSNFFGKHKVIFSSVILAIIGLALMFYGLSAPQGSNMIMFALIGMMILLSPVALITYSVEEKKKKKPVRRRTKGMLPVGNDYDELLMRHYVDVAELMKSRGFTNIVVMAEKKGVLDREGLVKGISIAGNAEFEENDEFPANAKVVIRYNSAKG